PFVMELPSYRMPTFRSIVYHMWDKTKHYLKKIGTIILVGVVIIWSLGYFPRETKETSLLENKIENVAANPAINEEAKQQQISELEQQLEAERLYNSYLGKIGHFIEPAMRPLGFDWKMSISLVAGLPAKEIVVSTMGVLYQSGEDDSTVNLQNKLQSEVHTKGKLEGQKVFTLPTALAFLAFILIYFPCVGVIATIKNEAGSWKWAAFVVFYTTGLAWITAFAIYNIGNLFI
ncbi:MAG TPA: nucleoside recognition domain-containing protein, partial [Tangfeifania sp.]|nr:nucleoside recognition domain-containing protein [Tangfeifania sp.]